MGGRKGKGAGSGFRGGFQAALRRNSRLALMVALIFIIAIFSGLMVGALRKSGAGVVIAGMIEEQMESMRKEALGLPYGLPLASYIIVNNVLLAVWMVALGILFGVFTVSTLFLNGVVLGYLPFYLAAHRQFVQVPEVLSAILPHAFIEFAAFLIAATCGTRMGISAAQAIVHGGASDRLRSAFKDVWNLLPVSILLFVIAGLIEGFISPLTGPGVAYAKLALSFLILVLLLLWFTGDGKKSRAKK
jgi:uncharacterized membrane protein SpoIIM required for sporulation